MEQFHADFQSAAALQNLVSASGFENWTQLFNARIDPHRNHEAPVLAPYHLVNPWDSSLVVYERNPYYWKVDPQGRQLPYIDSWEYVQVEDREAMQLQGVAGQSDLMIHWLAFDKWPVALQEAQRNNYRVVEEPFPINGGQLNVMFAYHHPDPEYRELFTKRDFRVALSLAIDRPEIVDIAYGGLNTAYHPIMHESHPSFNADMAVLREKYTGLDQGQANQMLDAVGLNRRDGDGWRLLPSGKRLEMLINVRVGFEAAGEIVARGWQEVGIFSAISAVENSTKNARRDAGELPVTLDGIVGGDSPLGQDRWHFPTGRNFFMIPYAAWFDSQGAEGIEPVEQAVFRLREIYEQASAELDENRRNEMIREAMTLHVENMWRIGVAQYPTLPGIVKNYVYNVPDVIQYSSAWPHGRYMRPEQFFIRGK